jgi:uncharacterized protein YjdB
MKTLFTLVLILFAINSYSQQLAFPSALGAGAYVTGGRGGEVYHVTNLNDSGTGSLRDALSQDNRTIVFDVSGVINLSSSLSVVNRSNVTIAGQTAPEGGITIDGDRVYFENFQNVIVRYIRFKGGIQSTAYNGGATNSFQSKGNSINQIFDHCTFAFGFFQGGSWYVEDDSSVDNLTVQRCFFANNDRGVLAGGGTGTNTITGEYSFISNLFYNQRHRTPNISGDGGRADVINNVVWNVQNRLIQLKGSVTLNHIGNYYDYNNNEANDYRMQMFSTSDGNLPVIYTDDNKYVSINTDENTTPLESTIAEINTDNTLAWKYFWEPNTGDQLPSNHFTATQHTLNGEPFIILSPDSAFADVKNNVGCNARLNADGSVSGNLDALDTEWLDGIKNGVYTVGALPYPPETSDGWIVPAISSVTRPAGYDTDNDGMSDLWETNTFGNLTKDGTGDDDSDGYTDLEEFLNEVDNPASSATSMADFGSIVSGYIAEDLTQTGQGAFIATWEDSFGSNDGTSTDSTKTTLNLDNGFKEVLFNGAMFDLGTASDLNFIPTKDPWTCVFHVGSALDSSVVNIIFAIGSGGVSSRQYSIYVHYNGGGKMRAEYGGEYATSSILVRPDDVIAVVYDPNISTNGTVTMYKNGSQGYSSELPGLPSDDDEPYNPFIGGRSNASSFDGSLKGLYIYDEALDQTAISNIQAFLKSTLSVIPLVGVTVTPSSDTITVGDTQLLTTTFDPIYATDTTGVWSSSDNSIASVNSSGLVTGIAEGSATITFTSNDGSFTDTSVITITAVATVPSMADFGSIVSGYIAEDLTQTGQGAFIATWEDSFGSNDGTSTDSTKTTLNLDNGFKEVLFNGAMFDLGTASDLNFIPTKDPWTCVFHVGSALDSSVVNIIFAIGSGGVSSRQYSIYVHYNGGGKMRAEYGGEYATSSILVRPDDVIAVVYDPNISTNGTVTMYKNGSQGYSSELPGLPSDDDEPYNPFIGGRSNASSFDGSLKGLYIYDEALDSTAVSNIQAFLVKPLVGVTVTPSSGTINVGDTLQLTTTFDPTGATDKTGVWSSSDNSISTVNSSGLVTGIAEGSVTITFTSNDGSFTDTCVITVVDVPSMADFGSIVSGFIAEDLTQTGQGAFIPTWEDSFGSNDGTSTDSTKTTLNFDNGYKEVFFNGAMFDLGTASDLNFIPTEDPWTCVYYVGSALNTSIINIIFAIGSGGVSSRQYSIYVHYNGDGAARSEYGGEYAISSVRVRADDIIAVVYNPNISMNGTVTMYKNGFQEYSSELPGLPSDDDEPYNPFIGGRSNASSFDGSLKGVYIYDEALDQTAISNIQAFLTSVRPTNVSSFKNEEFLVFPNPASSELNIRTSGNENHLISIYNSLGQEMFFSQKNKSSYNIDIKSWESGLYVVILRDINLNLIGKQKLIVK